MGIAYSVKCQCICECQKEMLCEQSDRGASMYTCDVTALVKPEKHGGRRRIEYIFFLTCLPGTDLSASARTIDTCSY